VDYNLQKQAAMVISKQAVAHEQYARALRCLHAAAKEDDMSKTVQQLCIEVGRQRYEYLKIRSFFAVIRKTRVDAHCSECTQFDACQESAELPSVLAANLWAQIVCHVKVPLYLQKLST